MNRNPLHRVLYIDLSDQQYRVEDRGELFSESIGGTGVASQLLEETCPPGIDPLSAQNPIILAVGPLTGLFPLASKTVAMFKSPLTGNLGESHAGGRSAVSIRLAGYGAIVITGASPSPVYLVIGEDTVQFRDASALWGLQSSQTVGRVIRQREQGSGTRTIMRIGPAGEQLMRYACVITETYRHFGRLGLGAVFGSKKLKAIVVSGNRAIEVASPKAYRAVYDEIFQEATDSPMMKKYHRIGTAENVEPLSVASGLPTKNLQNSSFANAANISGQRMAEQYLGRRLACAHCPVACIHIAALKEPHETEPYFYKTSLISYDYEPIYAMGSMLGIGDSRGILKLLDDVEQYGVDVMSAGVVLAWTTEALHQKLITKEELGEIDLQWGDWKAYQRVLKNIVLQPNELYAALAQGVDYASSRYGGSDFALAFGGNEMPGYHTGPAAYAGYLMGARHSHLDNAGYSIDQKCLAEGKHISPAEMAEDLIGEEIWRQVLSSAVVCFFARGIYTEKRMTNALAAAGVELSVAALHQIGEQTLKRKYAFKLRHGFSSQHLKIPKRIQQTSSSSGKINPEELRQVIVEMDKRLRS